MPEPTPSFDVTGVHKALDQAEQAYHKMFDGHVPDEVHRFGEFVKTVRMVADQSSDRANRGE